MPLPPPSPDELRRLADELHLPLDREHAELFGELIGGFLAGFELIDALPEPAAPEHPGRSWQRPAAAENPLGAWAARTQIREREDGALAGRTVAVKDNIAVAGVPMTGGASFLDGFVPQEDATVVRRVLEAGAEILGKAACEYLSASGGSHTSSSGVVRNPRDTTRSTGGSSSGCGALVAAGEVDLAIGGDQGGSIRFPASYCGIVGMKPTHGLVPYTGILAIEPHIDHTGPMTATVADNARLLDVLAGPDGLDPRQLGTRPVACEAALGTGVGGLTVGLLEEGFGMPEGDPAVDDAVRAAGERLAAAGAKLMPVSAPLHLIAGASVIPFLLMGSLDGMRQDAVVGGAVPRGLPEAFASWRERAAELPPNVQLILLAALHAERHGGRALLAKAMRVRHQVRALYDGALASVDALLLPTTTRTAPRLPAEGASLLEQIQATMEPAGNTGQFDVSGHPALSVPAGTVGGLPVGAMLVGAHFDEPLLYRIAETIEAG